MIVRSLIAVLALAFASNGFAAEPEYTGTTAPLPAHDGGPLVVVNDWDSVALDGLSGKTIADTLSKTSGIVESIGTRGVRDAEIYRKSSPAVVLVVHDKGFGSGIYLGSNQILTNWHVVQAFKVVGVIFKPEREGDKIEDASLMRADVIRTDPVRDLALLKVQAAPSGLRPLEFGSEGDIQVGADVHAIGHPLGGATWTYTKGLISQFRHDYQWKTHEVMHRASVVQTQTPINPGNSGGPLIGDSGKLIGVNAFKMQGEGINFAVSIGDVVAFLGGSGPSVTPWVSYAVTLNKKSCAVTQLYDGRNKTNDATMMLFDTNCDGVADAWFVTWDNKRKPLQALLDTNYDGKVDVTVNDTNHDGRWDISYHDTDFDGVIDLVGYHPDGKITPSRFERYVAMR